MDKKKIKVTTSQGKIVELTPEDYPVTIETPIYDKGEFKDVEYKLERHITGSQRIGEKKEK